MRQWILLPWLFGLGGCLFYDSTPGPASGAGEGAFAGECHNGEDDDGDRLVDCRDEDCFEASNCADHGLDSGGDTAVDTGTDSAADTSDVTASDTAAAARSGRTEADPGASDEEHSPLGAAAQLGAGALLVLLAGRSARRD